MSRPMFCTGLCSGVVRTVVVVALVVAFVVAALPLVDAAAEVQNVEFHLANGQVDGPTTPDVLGVVPESPEWYDGVTIRSAWRIDVYYETEGDTLTERFRDFALFVEGVSVPGCGWSLSRGSSSASRSQHTLAVSCEHFEGGNPAVVAPGQYNVSLRDTGGTLEIVKQVYSITLVQTEEVEPKMIEFGQVAWFLWVAFAVLVFMIRDAPLRFAVSTAGFMVVAIPMEAVSRDVLLGLQSLFAFVMMTRWMMK